MSEKSIADMPLYTNLDRIARGLSAHGIGAYISEATAIGDYPKIVLGVAMMSAFVIVFNRLLWSPLYGLAERRMRLD